MFVNAQTGGDVIEVAVADVDIGQGCFPKADITGHACVGNAVELEAISVDGIWQPGLYVIERHVIGVYGFAGSGLGLNLLPDGAFLGTQAIGVV